MEESLPFPDDILRSVIHFFAAQNLVFQDWLPLRLVNSFFNQQLLFAFFVAQVGRPHFRPRKYVLPDRRKRTSIQFKRLFTSWQLQGQVIRPGLQFPDPERLAHVQAIKDVVDYLESFPAQDSCYDPVTESVRSLEVAEFSKLLFHSSAALELTCRTLTSYYGPYDIYRVHSNGYCCFSRQTWDYIRRLKQNPSFILFILACYIGEITAVDYRLNCIQEGGLEQEEVQIAKLQGLVMLAAKGHTAVFQHLIFDRSVDVIDIDAGKSGWKPILCSAVLSGQFDVLETLLSTNYRQPIPQDALEQALVLAVEYFDQPISTRMTRKIHSYVKDLSPATRGVMLAGACYRRNLEQANWIIEDGSIDIYNDVHKPWGPPEHPLISAVLQQNMKMLRLILSANTVGLEQGKKIRILSAFDIALKQNRLDEAFELFPHVKDGCSEGDVWYHLAAFDGALQNFASAFGPFDSNLRLKSVAYPFGTRTQHRDRGFPESTLGECMLDAAVRELCFKNVQWLLCHGAHRVSNVWIWWRDYCGNAEDFHLMEKCLVEANEPGIEVVCLQRCTFRTPLRTKCRCNLS